MLRSEISIDFNLVDKYKDAVSNTLKNIKIKFEDLVDISGNINWFEDYNEEDLKELVFGLSSIEGLLDITIMEDSKKYNKQDSIKKLFLIHLSEKWESDITISFALNTMNTISGLERKFDKSVLEFNSDEIHESIIDLFSEMQYHKLRYQINILSKLQEYYGEQVANPHQWRDFKDTEVLRDIIGDEAKEHVLTKKDLIDLTRVMPNLQDSIIPLLIFEGVALSKVDDIDEIRYLKKNNLDGHRLEIRGNEENENTNRVIELSKDVAELLEDAINQEFIEKKVMSELRIVELEDTKFVLRPAVKARPKVNENEDMNILSFRGAYSRINLCKEYIEAFLYDIKFTPKSIETFGKVFYITKFVNEGYDDIEAIVMTLQRFGNWHPENGKRDARNSQQISRLRKVWNVYARV